jgi:hypothetical protein
MQGHNELSPYRGERHKRGSEVLGPLGAFFVTLALARGSQQFGSRCHDSHSDQLEGGHLASDRS